MIPPVLNFKSCSVISGTPPSIRIDSTIRAAPALLRQPSLYPQNKLLGEVELCLIWEKVRRLLYNPVGLAG
jgi:hypothetical protein